MPGPGVVVERSYIPSQLYEIAKNDEKTGGFAHVLAYKSPKTPFFAQKYLTRNTHETFFEEYTNFQAHYLSHCRLIPLQSFGSHIRPQPHGLGLMEAEKSTFGGELSFQWSECRAGFTVATIFMLCFKDFFVLTVWKNKKIGKKAPHLHLH